MAGYVAVYFDDTVYKVISKELLKPIFSKQLFGNHLVSAQIPHYVCQTVVSLEYKISIKYN